MTPSFKFRAWDESGKVMVYFDFQHLVRAALNDGRMDDGLPEGVARPRGWRNAALKAYGNAIVPKIAEQILRAMSLTNN